MGHAIPNRAPWVQNVRPPAADRPFEFCLCVDPGAGWSKMLRMDRKDDGSRDLSLP